MNDKDKVLEKAIDAMFFKTAKYNSQTGRSTQTFVCYECHHTTWKISNMRNHVRRHIKLKPFKCEGCGRGFAQSGQRDRHIRRKACLSRLPSAMVIKDKVDEEKLVALAKVDSSFTPDTTTGEQ